MVDTKYLITQETIENRPLSYSSLKQFRKSPKHYVEYLTTPYKGSDAMRMGSAFDIRVLTPELFDKKYQIFEKATGTGSVAKNKEQYELASKAKKILITKEELAHIDNAKESLMSIEMARKLIEGITTKKVKGKTYRGVQIPLNWRDKKTNLPLKGFADFESEVWDELWVVDLKSSSTKMGAEPDKFSRSALDLDYMIQAGAYLDAYHKTKYKFPYFIFMVAELVPPYNVSINFCENKYIETAKEEFHKTLQAFRYCMDHNLFHQGYEFRLMEAMDYFSMRIPAWFKSKY